MDEDLIEAALQFSPHVGNKQKKLTKSKPKNDTNKLSLKVYKKQPVEPPPRRLTRKTAALLESNHSSLEPEIAFHNNVSSGVYNVCPTCPSGKENLQRCQCAELISSDESWDKNPLRHETYQNKLISQLISEDESEGQKSRTNNSSSTYKTCRTSQQVPIQHEISVCEDELEILEASFQSFSVLTPEKSGVTEEVGSCEKVRRWLTRLSVTPNTSVNARQRHVSETSSSSGDDAVSSSLYPSTNANSKSSGIDSCRGTSMQSSLHTQGGPAFSLRQIQPSRSPSNAQAPVRNPKVCTTQQSSQSSDNDIFKNPSRLTGERASVISSAALSQATSADTNSSSQCFVDRPPWSKNKPAPKPKKKSMQKYLNSSAELSDIGELNESTEQHTPRNNSNCIPGTPSSAENSFHLVYNSTQPTHGTSTGSKALNKSNDSSAPDSASDTVPLSENCSLFATPAKLSRVTTDSASVADTLPWSESVFAYLGPPKIASSSSTFHWQNTNNNIVPVPERKQASVHKSNTSSGPSTLPWPSDCDFPLGPPSQPSPKVASQSNVSSIRSSAVFSNSSGGRMHSSVVGLNMRTTATPDRVAAQIDLSVIEITDDEDSTKQSDSESDSAEESPSKFYRRKSNRASYIEILSSGSDSEPESRGERIVIPESDSYSDSDDEVQVRTNRPRVGVIESSPIRKVSSEDEQEVGSQETYFSMHQSQTPVDLPLPEISQDEDEVDAARKLVFDSSSSGEERQLVEEQDTSRGKATWNPQTEKPRKLSKSLNYKSPVKTAIPPRKQGPVSSESSDGDDRLNRFFETARKQREQALRPRPPRKNSPKFIVSDSEEEEEEGSSEEEEDDHSPSLHHKTQNVTSWRDTTWEPNNRPKKPAPVRGQREAPRIVAPKPSHFENPPVPTTLSFLASLSAADHKRCHPEAVPFFKKFNSSKHKLAERLYAMFNAKVFDGLLADDMPIKWNNRLISTAGCCHNQRKSQGSGKSALRSSHIELSGKLLSDPGRLRDTLIHEMCHAATWVIDGCLGGHGPKWKKWTRKASRIFPELPEITRCHNYRTETKYTYKCTQCGYSFGRHTKSLDISRKVCGLCRGRFELIVNGAPASNPTPGRPNVFAVFVQEHYKIVKAGRKSLGHGDVMKILSQKFKEHKITQQKAQ